MIYRPLGDRVIVERFTPETRSQEGLIFPPSSTEKSSKGKVLAIGPGKRLSDGALVPVEVKLGDSVLFQEGYGVKTEKIEGKEILILSGSDILAVIEE